MKKQINRLIGRTASIFILLICFNSCEDLEVDTQGSLSAEGFYSSVADIESGTLGVYSVLADKLFANSESYCHFWAADDRTR